MTSLVPALANVGWAAAARGRYRRFRRALATPEVVQMQVLRRILAANAETVYGRRCRFDRIRSAEAFRARVPITTYDDYASFVARVRRGEPAVLTAEPVTRLIPSSGSTRARKLVPHTRGLQRSFDCAIGPWIVDMFRGTPALVAGRAYWSVSPVGDGAPDDTGAADDTGDTGAADDAVPIGFDADTAYLGGVLGRIVDRALAVPTPVRLIPDIEAFRYVTLRVLLAARDLRLISVWHPSFLLVLLASLERHFDALVRDVADGTLSAPGRVPAVVRDALGPRLRRAPARAAELVRHGPAYPGRLWPALGLISCWADGNAAVTIDAVRRVFPGIAIQPKGLIATEGFVTVPFGGMRPLAVRSHYFEFVDDGGVVHDAAALRDDAEYEVLLTTAGGLYRYRLGDRVRVDGRCGRTPSLVFVGRADGVSDRCGEKLSEGFVAGVLRDLFARHDAAPRFAMLAPREDPTGWRYVLHVETPARLPADAARDLETGLERNPHYRYCVRLGQLAPASIVELVPGALDRYVESHRAAGMTVGAIKPPALATDGAWLASSVRE